MQLTKGALAQTIAFLALAGLLAETRRELEAVRAEHHPPHRALDGADSSSRSAPSETTHADSNRARPLVPSANS